ncbi:XVIPCD domain-containing protein [Stenotrophomonas sp. WHRI 8082]|uniref:XVIPCD domain-containing protein n=1 Tax=Stenotrophomonas sp. WHRI 8082 TaxID=3162571 RepID=UPI0032EC87E4
MTEINISAAADDVVALLRSQRALEAAAQLQTLREAQTLVVQEALERYVAVRAAPELAALGQTGGVVAADRATVTPMLERLHAASRPPRMPASTETATLSQAQQHDVYGSMVELRGDQAAREAMATQDRVILGLRQETRTTDRRGQGEFDDRIVVLWRDAGGQGHSREFIEANTEPSAQYDGHAKTTPASPGFTNVITRRKTEGEDVNADRIRDLGRLAEGTVEMRATTHPRSGHPDEFSLRPTAAAVRAGAYAVERDSNGDGWFDTRDIHGVQRLNTTFKIHRGGDENTYSAGCQTIQTSEYDAFVETVRGTPGQGSWHYVLTSVSREQNQHIAQPNDLGPIRDPRQSEHPDHALQQQISQRLHDMGGQYADSADDYSLVLLHEAKSSGITRVDQVISSNPVGDRAAGETIFLVQGVAGDPASLRVGVNAAEVTGTSVETSLRKLELQQQEHEQAPPIHAQGDAVQQANAVMQRGH